MDSYEKEFLENFHERLIKDFIDIFILAKLSDGKAMSGYDFVRFFHKKFDVMFSSGTVYSQLYALERQGLLQRNRVSRKTAYSISKKTQKVIHVVTTLNSKIMELLESLSSQV